MVFVREVEYSLIRCR